jgi:hypothetical protein
MKIEQNRNWCEIDILDGITLIDGEWLYIKFPDNSIFEGSIIVKKTSETVNDMGQPYNMPISRAYIKEWVRGVDVLVPLIGMEAKRK